MNAVDLNTANDVPAKVDKGGGAKEDLAAHDVTVDMVEMGPEGFEGESSNPAKVDMGPKVLKVLQGTV